jgi:hypothetical protein
MANICHMAGKNDVVADALSRPAEVKQCPGPSSSGGRPVPDRNVPPSTPPHQTEFSPLSLLTPLQKTKTSSSVVDPKLFFQIRIRI